MEIFSRCHLGLGFGANRNMCIRSIVPKKPYQNQTQCRSDEFQRYHHLKFPRWRKFEVKKPNKDEFQNLSGKTLDIFLQHQNSPLVIWLHAYLQRRYFKPWSHLADLESHPPTTWELPTTADLILVWRERDRSRPSNDHSRLLPASSDGRQSL